MSQPSRSEPEGSSLSHAYRDLQSPGSESCPDEEALAGFAVGDTPPGERDRLADHVISCRRCSESYQILARTHAETAPVRRFDARGWIAAAVIVCAFAAGVWIARRDQARTEVMRGPSSPSESFVVPRDGADLSTSPSELLWPAQDGADSYRVQLFSAAGEKLWESELSSQPRTQLPASVGAKLHGGRSYFWTVVVEGQPEKGRLGPYTFALR